MSTFHYVDIDYKDGRLGVRFEPKNPDIVQALLANIPSTMRLYMAPKRRWILDPVCGPLVVRIITDFCPDAPVQIEQKNEELILSLLFGPDTLPGRVQIPNVPVQIPLGGPNIFKWYEISGVRR